MVKILSTTICGAQIGEIQGKTGKDKWIPHCLGHEGFGIIIKKNKSDNKFKINDQVIMHWRKSDGINSKPTSYLNGKKIINAGLITTFQEYAVVSENRLSKVNNFKRYKDIAPLLGCALTTSWGILNKEVKIYYKDKLLIFGAGGIGLSLGVIAKIQKIKNITLIDKSGFKSNLAKKMGLKIINLKSLSKIKKNKYNLVIDTTGDVKNIGYGFDLVDKNGTLMLVGQPKINSELKIKNPLRLFNPPQDHIKVVSSDGGMFDPTKDYKKLFKLVKKNYKYLKKLISHKIKLDDINKGIDLILKGKAGRVLIEMDK